MAARVGRYPDRGVYGKPFNTLYTFGVRGAFNQGFGAISSQYRGALKWTYDTFVHNLQDTKDWNAPTYPHQAMYAFINWPIGEEAQNPGDVLPKVLVDTDHGYICARNGWQDENDVIVTHLMEIGPRGYYVASEGDARGRAGRMAVWALGQEHTVNVNARSKPDYFATATDGSFI